VCTEKVKPIKTQCEHGMNDEEEREEEPSGPIAEKNENLTTESVISEETFVTIKVAKSNLNCF